MFVQIVVFYKAVVLQHIIFLKSPVVNNLYLKWYFIQKYAIDQYNTK